MQNIFHYSGENQAGDKWAEENAMGRRSPESWRAEHDGKVAGKIYMPREAWKFFNNFKTSYM